MIEASTMGGDELFEFFGFGRKRQKNMKKTRIFV
jgi:hypothetical protein